MRCETCRGTLGACGEVPIIGRVCETCFAKLSRPVIHDGGIPLGLSMAELCLRTQANWHRQRERLVEQARIVCEGPT